MDNDDDYESMSDDEVEFPAQKGQFYRSEKVVGQP